LVLGGNRGRETKVNDAPLRTNEIPQVPLEGCSKIASRGRRRYVRRKSGGGTSQPENMVGRELGSKITVGQPRITRGRVREKGKRLLSAEREK